MHIIFKLQKIIIFNVYAPTKRVWNYKRQKLIELQEEINKSTIIIRGFNTPPSEMIQQAENR